MNVPDSVKPYLTHIENWETQIRPDVIVILEKLQRGEQLSESELDVDITPHETAAIWTFLRRNRPDRDTSPDLVRQMRRLGHLKASQQWGTGLGARYLYRMRDVLSVKIKTRGRPRKVLEEAKQ
jgi:hypothetical protein